MTDQSFMGWLGQIQSQVKNNESPSVSVRELLKRFDAQRRGIHVVSKIRNALTAYDLETVPDFEGEYVDNIISFRVPERTLNVARDDDKEPLAEPLTDPTFRIGKLPAANTIFLFL